jgi:hypothetical protein
MPVTYGKTGQNSNQSCSSCRPGDGYDDVKKICKTCDVNFASPGGISKCKQCTGDKPTTFGKTNQATCFSCNPGDEFDKNSGKCTACKLGFYNPDGKGDCQSCDTTNGKLVEMDITNDIEKIKRTGCVNTCKPGFGFDGHEYFVEIEGKLKSGLEKGCKKCDQGSFSEGGTNKCRQCPHGTSSSTSGASTCTKGEWQLEIERKQNEAFERWKTISNENALSERIQGKLVRQLAEDAVRTEYNKMRKNRLQPDKIALRTYCERQEKPYSDTNNNEQPGVVIYPGVPLLNEEIDEKSCVSENRDRIIRSFCPFRDKLNRELQRRSRLNHVSRTSYYYWPHICCDVERKCGDTTERTTGETDNMGRSNIDTYLKQGVIDRDKLIPFAGTQGGKNTKDNLFSEIEDLLGHHKKGDKREHGHLRNGFNAVLDEVKSRYNTNDLDVSEIEALGNRMDRVFENINLCGPRVFKSPKTEKIQICQLFYSYDNIFDEFLNGFMQLFAKLDGKRFTPEGAKFGPKVLNRRRRRLLSFLRVKDRKKNF